jgi:hypothetical protein
MLCPASRLRAASGLEDVGKSNRPIERLLVREVCGSDELLAAGIALRSPDVNCESIGIVASLDIVKGFRSAFEIATAVER